ncbi:MAG TPA: hypothetical protein DF383_07270 [Deltaproteobacteria bacterium]|nr:hypothetical protein [Deltaproteobacteria bacterium]
MQALRLETDHYSFNLLPWLGSDPKRIAYCSEAQLELGIGKVHGAKLIAKGQQREKDEVMALVRKSLLALCM